MNISFIPENYFSRLNLYETQEAIAIIKEHFAYLLCKALNLKRVSAPLFVATNSGLNDDLSGVERPVRFDMKHLPQNAEVVHSLAKWKRLALAKYGFPVGEGLYTDMNAIRRDEVLDNIHSIYVDQWDWERVITPEMRTMATLKDTMQRIVTAICSTLDMLKWKYSRLDTVLCREASFILSQELEDMYPALTPKEREYEYVKKYKTACILQIGGKLKSGNPHDMRAPDYDDWQLNGDILFWSEELQMPMELSSMGIRVSPESLIEQLKLSNCEHRLEYPFHRALADGKLPYTIGGGIGQSRLCMLLLQKAHIGEVQSSCWDEGTIDICRNAGVRLL
ncbi:MAG: aspartate--ammonia ligase [Christensenellaceae bacterium]|nr:aspartate--ammonia ligase [Christensenellaceae bacterium]